MLQVGSTGINVMKAQDLLNKKTKFSAPTKPLVVDGNFGPLTQAMVRLFQNQNGLVVTGSIDNATGVKLGMFPTELVSTPPKTTSTVTSTAARTPVITAPSFFEKNKKNIMILAGGLGAVLVFSLLMKKAPMGEIPVMSNPRKKKRK
jgi:peptidoglycan hydrolase-like protein with peptidoglycan-binding domain